MRQVKPYSSFNICALLTMCQCQPPSVQHWFHSTFYVGRAEKLTFLSIQEFRQMQDNTLQSVSATTENEA